MGGPASARRFVPRPSFPASFSPAAMFAALGRFVSTRWGLLLAAWVALTAGVLAVRPAWEDVTADGEFAFLPEDVPSREAEALFREAFTGDLLRSSVVLVVRRPRGDGLREEDDAFLQNRLYPALRDTLVAGGFADPGLTIGGAGPAETTDGDDGEAVSQPPPAADPDAKPPLVRQAATASDRVVGPLFASDDGQAKLVVLGLGSEFGEARNVPLVAAAEGLIAGLIRSGEVPPGLEVKLSGTAVVGRDTRLAEFRSAEATHVATVVLVVGLLLVIYRAPLLALVPLATVYISVEIAMGLLSLAAGAGWFAPFAGLEIYVTVVTYGAGVDYCMFLTARYREEVDRLGAGGPGSGDGREAGDWGGALASAVAKIGPALTASAGTTALGIGMMAFAEFAKFRQAGVGICVGLCVVSVASVTFAPACLRGLGGLAFWPKVPHGAPATGGGWLADAGTLAGSGAVSGRSQRRLLRRFWAAAADRVCDNPGRWFAGTLVAMALPAAVGLFAQRDLTYGLLSELPPDAPSVRGAAAVRAHFPAGEAGPLTVLVTSPTRPGDDPIDFRDREGPGKRLVGDLTERLWAEREDLGLAELRSMSHPLGVPAGTELPPPAEPRSGVLGALLARGGENVAVRNYYIADGGLGAGRIARLDVVLAEDPFTREALDRLDALKAAVRDALPPALAGGESYVLGATASVRDLAAVTGRDQTRINVLVLGAVLTVLVVLLRRVGLSLYLVATVVLGYLTTLGATWLLFRTLAELGGGPFPGLDWKVPVLLFTILVAVGEDYNIYLVTRIDEERADLAAAGLPPRVAAVRGVRAALGRTGAVISGCGLIMAGTFASLTVGELAGMVQLGVALAGGVLLDTFLIRPVLVPSYLCLLHSGRFGAIGRLLGAAEDAPDADPEPAHENFAATP